MKLLVTISLLIVAGCSEPVKVCRKEAIENIQCYTKGGFHGGVICRIETKSYLETRYSPYLKGELIKVCELK